MPAVAVRRAPADLLLQLRDQCAPPPLEVVVGRQGRGPRVRGRQRRLAGLPGHHAADGEGARRRRVLCEAAVGVGGGARGGVVGVGGERPAAAVRRLAGGRWPLDAVVAVVGARRRGRGARAVAVRAGAAPRRPPAARAQRRRQRRRAGAAPLLLRQRRRHVERRRHRRRRRRRQRRRHRRFVHGERPALAQPGVQPPQQRHGAAPAARRRPRGGVCDVCALPGVQPLCRPAERGGHVCVARRRPSSLHRDGRGRRLQQPLLLPAARGRRRGRRERRAPPPQPPPPLRDALVPQRQVFRRASVPGRRQRGGGVAEGVVLLLAGGGGGGGGGGGDGSGGRGRPADAVAQRRHAQQARRRGVVGVHGGPRVVAEQHHRGGGGDAECRAGCRGRRRERRGGGGGDAQLSAFRERLPLGRLTRAALPLRTAASDVLPAPMRAIAVHSACRSAGLRWRGRTVGLLTLLPLHTQQYGNVTVHAMRLRFKLLLTGIASG